MSEDEEILSLEETLEQIGLMDEYDDSDYGRARMDAYLVLKERINDAGTATASEPDGADRSPTVPSPSN